MRDALKIGQTTVFAHKCPEGFSGDELRALALSLRDVQANSLVVLSSVLDEKVVLVAATDEAARKDGVKAGAIVKIASAVLGGGGGGKDDFAQGGGTNSSALDQSFEALIASLRN